jgi:hypothetical protein
MVFGGRTEYLVALASSFVDPMECEGSADGTRLKMAPILVDACLVKLRQWLEHPFGSIEA